MPTWFGQATLEEKAAVDKAAADKAALAKAAADKAAHEAEVIARAKQKVDAAMQRKEHVKQVQAVVDAKKAAQEQQFHARIKGQKAVKPFDSVFGQSWEHTVGAKQAKTQADFIKNQDRKKWTKSFANPNEIQVVKQEGLASGSRDRAEVAAVREKMNQAQAQYPTVGMMAMFKKPQPKVVAPVVEAAPVLVK